MRLWIEAISSFGSVVMIVVESTSEPSGDCQRSHSPAKAKGSPERRWIRWGTLVLTPGVLCHSKKPFVKTRQRR